VGPAVFSLFRRVGCCPGRGPDVGSDLVIWSLFSFIHGLGTCANRGAYLRPVDRHAVLTRGSVRWPWCNLRERFPTPRLHDVRREGRPWHRPAELCANADSPSDIAAARVIASDSMTSCAGQRLRRGLDCTAVSVLGAIRRRLPRLLHAVFEELRVRPPRGTCNLLEFHNARTSYLQRDR